MNLPSEENIEQLLRGAPRPAPPRGLKEKLIMQTKMNPNRSRSGEAMANASRGGWLRRWWPILVPGAVSVACAALVGVQQVQIHDLQQEIRTLSTGLEAQKTPPSPTPSAGSTPPADSSETQSKEINRLKESAASLESEIAQFKQLQTENQSLRAQLSKPPPGLFSQQELDAMNEARARAEKIACVNNLKQIGLAARIWAGDNSNAAPPDFLSMSNELSTPKVLVCPADTARQVATSFATYTAANCSYEYLIAGSTNWETEPDRVMARCPIHGTVLLCDGSVQMISTNHPEWFVQRDGKLYYEPKPSSKTGAAP